MRIVCEQKILMKYHALFVCFFKKRQNLNCRLGQNIGGALRVKCYIDMECASYNDVSNSLYT